MTRNQKATYRKGIATLSEYITFTIGVIFTLTIGYTILALIYTIA